MSTVDKVLIAINEMKLGVGDRLPSERQLAQCCGISRSSVRNVFKELQSRRVVDSKRGSGYFIASDFALRQVLDRQDTRWTATRVQQVIEARSLVVARLVELGSEAMKGKELEELEACLVELGKAVINSDVHAMEVLHNRFVNYIFEKCPNLEFIRMIEEVRIPSYYMERVLAAAEGDERNQFFSDHVNLFQAIKKRDHAQAKQLCIRICAMLATFFKKYESSVFI